MQKPGRAKRSLSLFRRLPLAEEGEPLGLIQIFEQLRPDRNRARLVADQLGHTLERRFAIDVGAQRIEIGLVGDDLLTALRQQIVEEKFAGVRE